jgi:DNA polymerase-1
MGPPKSPTDDFLRLSKHIEGGNGGPTRVVASWHPAYALRNSDAFPSLVADVGKLKGVKTDIWQPPDWKYFENPVDAQTVLTQIMAWQDLHQSYELVVDIETGIDKDNSYDHPNEYDLLCVGLGYTKGKVVVIGYDPCHAKSVLDLLKKLFRRSKLIAQNGKFDLAGLYPHLGPLELWFDTMLASYCLDERPGNHKLKTLGLELLGTPEWEHEILRFIPRGGNYANIPRPVLYKYNAYDVAVTWDLKELFTPKLDTPRRPDDWPYQDRPFKSLRDLHDFLVRASNQLMFLELNGLTIDRAYQNKLREIFGVRLGTLESRLTEIAGYELNPRSPKQLKEYFAEQKIMLDSTNKDTLEQLLEILRKRDDTTSDTVQFIETLLVHRRQQKLSSTYVEGIRKRMYRGRVYSTYLLHGSTSGRLTSRNPNLQNIDRDRDIRRQFAVAKPENIFVHTDFKQAEGRVIAYLAQDEYLREVFNNPKIDIFDELSNQLYGVGNWRKEVERIRTKAFFYGLSYGREAYSIAMEFGLSVSEAERRMQEFLSLIPATAAWQKATRDEVLAGKDLITPFGRRRRFWLITEHNKKDILNEALSFLPQSTSSDICLDALIHIRPRLRGIGFVRLTIHDALVAECHESRREEVTNIMIEEMMAAGERFTNYVPFPVDVSYGKTWGDL